MKNPCNICIVQSMCHKYCDDLRIFIKNCFKEFILGNNDSAISYWLKRSKAFSAINTVTFGQISLRYEFHNNNGNYYSTIDVGHMVMSFKNGKISNAKFYGNLRYMDLEVKI